jgi:hypothetical protein
MQPESKGEGEAAESPEGPKGNSQDITAAGWTSELRLRLEDSRFLHLGWLIEAPGVGRCAVGQRANSRFALATTS